MTAVAAAQGSGRVCCATARPRPPSTIAALDYWKPESSCRPEQTDWALRVKTWRRLKRVEVVAFFLL